MSRFADLLRSTLTGVNDAFDSARTDLASLVEEVDRATKSFDPNLYVKLIERANSPSGTVYALAVGMEGAMSTDETDRDMTQRVMFYRVSPDGYPIAYSTSESALRVGEELDSRSRLQQDVEQLLTNKGSPLIAAFTFLLR